MRAHTLLVVAPDAQGAAEGALYVDDGVSIKQKRTTRARFAYKGGKLSVTGAFAYPLGVNVSRVRFAGARGAPKRVRVNGKSVSGDKVAFDVTLDLPFKAGFTVELD